MGLDNPERITYFAETDARNRRTPFGIKSKDRSRHMYVIGKTGMGKSTLLENLAVQDIRHGQGLVFVDPHGKSADLLLDYIPQERIKDVMYFAPFDVGYPISFNIMEDVGYDKRHLVMSGLISAFKKIWVDAWSARMEYILSNTLLALLEYPEATLLSVNRMYSDKEYRKKVVANVCDPTVKSFWLDEYEKYTDRFAAEATPAIQNKIGQFTSNPIIRNIIGQPKSSFDLREMMDNRKIILVNLSKGQVGEVNSNLLGSMLITKIYLSAMSRADVSEAELARLPDLHLHVDEFQSFANESFADILSEARKYKLSLTLAHQYIAQMSEEVRDAVFGNVGTMISFRVGAYDAEVLEKEFAPVFTQEDMVNLGFAQVYLKLMISGVTSQPFSATTLPPIEPPEGSLREQIIEQSRSTFAASRSRVEKHINDWHIRQTESGATGRETKKNAPSGGAQGSTDKNKTQKPKQSSTKHSDSDNRPGYRSTGQAKPQTPPPEKDELSPAEELRRGLAAEGKSEGGNKGFQPAPNRQALREALASVAKQQINKNQPEPETKKPADRAKSRDQGESADPAKSAPGQSQNSSASAAGSNSVPPTGRKKNEIPAEELKKILEVEE